MIVTVLLQYHFKINFTRLQGGGSSEPPRTPLATGLEVLDTYLQFICSMMEF